jgi:hypothetical protein
MSASTVDVALVTQFSDMLHVKSQQIRSRLRKYFKMIPMNGDKFAYDGIGTVEAREVSGRLVKTTFDDIEHLRRKIKRRRFVVTLPIDASDVRGMLLNPQGPYAEACVRAMERVHDRVGIEAAFANVQTGRDFETDVTFANDGGNTVVATAGLTYEKLLEIRKFWRNNEVGQEIFESMLFLITGDEEDALMKETELISGDYSRQFVVDKGEIKTAAGLDLICYGADVPNPLLSVASGVRSCIALTGRGLVYGLSKAMGVSVDPRKDYIETDQVQIIGELGAVRTEGLLVQKVTTTTA